jgi:hypothetical protein
MRPLTARIVYSVCLCTLAACAALPETPSAAPAPRMQSTGHLILQPSGIAADLASVMRRQAELSESYGASHAETLKVATHAASLRDTGLLADPEEFEGNLIRALSDQLANARRDHALLVAHHGETHPEAVKAEGVVFALTTAINREVRRIKSAA